MVRFFICGDPQIGLHAQEELTRMKIPRMRDNVLSNDLNICIIPGDLTDNGVGPGCVMCPPIFRMFCMGKSPFTGAACNTSLAGADDELSRFKHDVLYPLETICDDVFICDGNHDRGHFKMTPVPDFIKSRHGSLCYSYVRDDILIICLSEYPRKDRLEYLDTMLRSTTNYVVIFFHYNLYGPFSEFWSDEEKTNFYNAVIGYKDRLLFIATGHVHASYVDNWKGLLVVNGSGLEVVCIDVYDDEDGKKKVQTKML